MIPRSRRCSWKRHEPARQATRSGFKGRPQFVTHIRQKRAFDAVRPFRYVPGDDEFLRALIDELLQSLLS